MQGESLSQYLLETVASRFFQFLEYVGSFKRLKHFKQLPDLLKIYDKVDPEKAPRMFVEICGVFRGEQVKVTADMVKAGMKHMLLENKEEHAALGLLRMAFMNDISFASFDIKYLLKF